MKRINANAKESNKMCGYALAILKSYEILEKKSISIKEENENVCHEDRLLIPGLVISSVILLAYSGEIILKTWLGKTKGSYPQTHDLEKLLEEFDDKIWKLFGKHEKEMIQTVFEQHSNIFTHWRYLFENVQRDDHKVHPDPKLKASIKILIDRYRFWAYLP